MPKIAPELVNSKNISYLVEFGKKYDEAAKNNAEAAKWQEIIDILKKIP